MYYNPENEDYNFEPLNNKNDLSYYINSKEENQRAKRDDQKINTNEEYLKQLDYSFPQTVQQNHKNYGNDFKNPHVRVKRN
ncbi:uncharacterized protein LOC124421360 [Lucilia cuprina]|uniref:uncharacterized protein LOC124421360 n=1 Tax=Lucilia cuprina TaxID=7375 RepID=UPI001F069AB6|nr:uncharacterized protein LOC124421360 [Lucilia cuprina]